ncbi:MAG: hypothetical protein OXN21_05250 [Chloroflexota bacterium]|nr:hypothetical protein [Chloroflexota bacterium]
MTRSGGPADGTPSLESLRQLRLQALLNDLVHDLGPVKAAERLGIDRKTLWRNEGAGEMSARLVEALERLLLERAAADGQRVVALEERVGDLERQLAHLLTGKSGGGNDGPAGHAAIAALQRRFTQEIQRLEGRLDRQEGLRGTAPPLSRGGSRTGRHGPGRRYPEVVAWRPADDDEAAYGAAWPLVDEWRRRWTGHFPTGRGLAWVATRQRILELELAMLEEHGLTLPRETAPLRGLDRNEQLSWRLRELAGIRRRRARLELLRRALRLLTLGRWARDGRGR